MKTSKKLASKTVSALRAEVRELESPMNWVAAAGYGQTGVDSRMELLLEELVRRGEEC